MTSIAHSADSRLFRARFFVVFDGRLPPCAQIATLRACEAKPAHDHPLPVVMKRGRRYYESDKTGIFLHTVLHIARRMAEIAK